MINGQTYYYAVVSYDHGDSIGIPPTECTKKITVDPITSQLTFDVNTAQVIPGPRASGYVYPAIEAQNVQHPAGIRHRRRHFEILNDLAGPGGGKYHAHLRRLGLLRQQEHPGEELLGAGREAR